MRSTSTGTLPGARPDFADIVVHTSGPFQRQDHRVARACIAQGCHYLDLADARDFVVSIGELDAAARERGVIVVSGASSVPCLTAAVIVVPGPASRGSTRSTTASAPRSRPIVVSRRRRQFVDVGKPLLRLRDGRMQRAFGWQEYPRRSLSGTGASAVQGIATSQIVSSSRDAIRSCAASSALPPDTNSRSCTRALGLSAGWCGSGWSDRSTRMPSAS